MQIPDKQTFLTFAGSLLQLRGCNPVSTPLLDQPNSKNVLLYNGEIFGGLEIADHANDAAALFQALNSSSPDEIPCILSQLRGPWAVVFWHHASNTLYFGRDVLGRRSLLIQWPTEKNDDNFILTSVVPLTDKEEDREDVSGYEEVEPGVYSLEIKKIGKAGRESTINRENLTHFPWRDESIEDIHVFERPQDLVEPLEDEQAAASDRAAAVDGVFAALRAAAGIRCRCIDIPSNFEYSKTINSPENAESSLLLPPSRILILFSGGVDSTLLAALTHESLPPDEPIDLISICFANGTSPDRLAAIDSFNELKKFAPTRKWRLLATDRSLEDIDAGKERILRLLFPSDTVMDLNIGAALWLAADGEGYVLLDSSMENNDNSNGSIPKEEEETTRKKVFYRSAARCVFLGHGADELFGGYGRHRTKFRNAAWEGLSEELGVDVKRLWKRNLGRDDRLIADRRREARHPFLDENVVLQSLNYYKLASLSDLRLPGGEGDKIVLREILKRLGLPRAGERVKRAIQFGTRLAKASNTAQFGGTKKANAKNAGSVRLSEIN